MDESDGTEIDDYDMLVDVHHGYCCHPATEAWPSKLIKLIDCFFSSEKPLSTMYKLESFGDSSYH